jgi:hypothetical protein
VEPPDQPQMTQLRARIVNGELDGTWLLAGQDQFLRVDAPIDGHPGWWVEATFVVTQSDLALISLSVSKKESDSTPPHALTVAVLRAVRLEGLYRQARGRVLNPTLTSGQWFFVQDGFQGSARPGRKGRADVEYADIARRYVGFVSTSAKPIEALAEQMAVSKSSASSYVHEARRRGLLTSTPQGSPGGRLTEKAIELLRRAPNVGEEAR